MFDFCYSIVFVIKCLYMAVVVYAPALALSQGNYFLCQFNYKMVLIDKMISVTGINVYVSCTAIFLVCIFYTAVVSQLQFKHLVHANI